MYIKELTNDEFFNFTNSYPLKSIYQTKEYALVMNKQGYESIFLGLIDNNKIIGATMLLIEKQLSFKYAYAPRGFLLNYNDFSLVKEFTDEIKKYLSVKEVVAIKLSPLIIKNGYDKNNKDFYKNTNYDNIYNYLKSLDYYHFGYNNFFEALRPRFEAIIDLSKNEDILYNNLSKSFKNNIKKSEKNGIKIVEGNYEELTILYNQVKEKYPRGLNYLQEMYKYFSKNNMIKLYLAKLDTKKFLTINKIKYENTEIIANDLNYRLMSNPNNNFKIIKSKIEKDNLLEKYKVKLINATKLLTEHPEGIYLASVLIGIQDKQVYLFIDGYDKAYNNLNAKHILLWELIKKYSKEGYKIFNLGGISNIMIEENKYKGLNEFKKSLGCSTIEYMGDLEIITNNTLYFMYKKLKPLKKMIKK